MNESKLQKSEDESKKILLNFYITQKTSEQIDDITFFIKRALPFEKRNKLTKSNFCEIGFKILIEDYNNQGEESLLWKAIHEALGD